MSETIETKPTTRTIKVNYLARVEGEGALHARIKGDQVTDVRLQIFEPPRFFEAFLRGRKFTEAPDITARICGICPIAYLMGATHAMEDACGVRVDPMIRLLRRLIYLGEWIESHALHIFMLHAPDFLGYQDAIQMAKDHPELVQRGLALKKVGNDIMSVIGGREIHPVNLRLGGFYRLPTNAELAPLRERLIWARDAAYETARLTATLDIPKFEQDYTFLALSRPDEYAIIDGHFITNRGHEFPIPEFEYVTEEFHVQHSTSLHARLKNGETYMVGPMARFNLNFDQLSPLARQAALEVGLIPPVRNPFKSIVVRSIELLYACDEAIRLIDRYHMPARSFTEVHPKAGVGYGCTEAPRGICWHRYRIDDNGIIQDARIVPPTSQNQRVIEQDMAAFIQANLDMPDDKLQWTCEQGIRNYDPCISCSCHYLKLHIEREG